MVYLGFCWLVGELGLGFGKLVLLVDSPVLG